MSQVVATDNKNNKRENYCQLLIWSKNPDAVDNMELLSKIMNLGTWEMWKWAWKHFLFIKKIQI